MIAEPPPRRTASQKGYMRAGTLLASFRYAFAGVRHLFLTQRNAQIHAAIGVIAVAFGVAFQISQAEWLSLVIISALVVAAEGVNTAIEAIVDMVSPEYHPLAKVAKDVGAGTVLLTAIAAVIVGLIVFLPRLLELAATLLRLNI